MGQYATAWVGFGFKVPENLTNDEMETRLDSKRWPDTGYFSAGRLGESEMYVVTAAHSAIPGTVTKYGGANEYMEDRWTEELVAVAKANGWLPADHDGLDHYSLEIGWFVAADLS